MRKRGLTGTIVMMWIVAVLAVILGATYFLTTKFLIVDWQLFPRHRQTLDLRRQTLSYEKYDTLAWQLPDTEILWNVPFQGTAYPQDTKELTVDTLDAKDVKAVRYFPQLETIHAQTCTEYAALAALTEAYPKVHVEYAVPIGGERISGDTKILAVTDLTAHDVQMLPYLTKLTTIDGTGCRNAELLHQLQQDHPSWKILLRDSIAGTTITPETTHLEVEGADYTELSVGLSNMPNLRSLLVRNPLASAQELGTLRQEYPNVDIHWEVEFAGQTHGDGEREVDLSAAPIFSINQAKEIASKFPNLEKLILDSGSISNDDMARYRDEARPDYKVVWTVYFTSKCKARTDETYFMPIKQGEYYFQEQHVYNLRYCEDMVCVDIGHSTVKDVTFASFMPHLKYLILAWTQVTDISPLENCKELIYLEIDHGIVHDLSPLLGCTALEDLNITDQQVKNSIDPICSMTWLKTLWCPDRNYNDKMRLVESLPDTRVVTTDASSASGHGWRNLPNYYAMRDYLGMYYMN